MAKFIFSIVNRINQLNRKGLSPYYTPEIICDEVHAASMNLWKKYVADFERTQIISSFLDPFRNKEIVNLVSGAGTLTTSNGQYKTAVFLPTSDIQVTQSDLSHWGNLVNDSVRGPAVDHPICRIDGPEIIVRPDTLGSVIVHFLKNPILPVYAYTVVDEDFIYDDATSVDIFWNEVVHDEITKRVFAQIGIMQREQSLNQYSNVEQQKESK